MMQIMPLSCDGEKILLSRCSIGEVWKCRCCDDCRLDLGRITFYLSSIDLVFLAEMLIEALEHNALCDFDEKKLRGENA